MTEVVLRVVCAVTLIPCAAYMVGTEQWLFAALFSFWITVFLILGARRLLLLLKIRQLKQKIEEIKQAQS